MFSLTTKKSETGNVVSYRGELEVYADRALAKYFIPEVMKLVTERYVEENYDDIIKLIDIDAFKANLTIALTVEASQKVRSSL